MWLKLKWAWMWFAPRVNHFHVACKECTIHFAKIRILVFEISCLQNLITHRHTDWQIDDTKYIISHQVADNSNKDSQCYNWHLPMTGKYVNFITGNGTFLHVILNLHFPAVSKISVSGFSKTNTECCGYMWNKFILK